MLRLMSGLAAALLMAGPALAGELDGEFAGKKMPAGINKITSHSTAAAKLSQPVGADKVSASELDDESPAQAYRAGWGGYRGYGYRGYGYRNYGYRNYGYRNYGYRNYGYRWGGYYGNYGYGRSYYGYPSYGNYRYNYSYWY